MFPVIRRLIVACVVVLLASGVTSHAVQAHGVLQRSWPKANAVLPVPPAEIILEFNEAVDPHFSRFVVIGPRGRSQARGGVVSGAGRGLTLSLGGAGPGLYTVQWRVLSAVDGHTTAGSFVFAVGESAAVPAGPAPSAAALPPPIVIAARWLTYLAAMLLAGTALFDPIILRWSLDRVDPVLAAVTDAGATGVLTRLRRASGLVLLVALVVEFIVQGGEVLGGGAGAVLRRDVLSSLLVDTKLGWSVLVRAFAAVLLLLPSSPSSRILRAAGLVWFVVFAAVVVLLGGPGALRSSHVTLIVLVGTVYGLASVLAARIIPAIPDVHVPEWRGAGAVAAGVLLAGFTLSSHAGGRGGVLALSDWLHLMAAATWVGGLPACILVLHSTSADLRQDLARVLVPRVSALAGLSLLVMVVTGIVASSAFVASLRGFVATSYGRTLMLKLALAAVVVVLGAINRFALRPRILSRDAAALDHFGRNITLETALAAVILLIVAALTIMPPAAVTSTPQGGGLPSGGVHRSGQR